VALTGTLKDFGIAEILQLIGQQAKSGVLHLNSRDEEVHVAMADGCVVSAEDARRAPKHRLGELLVRAGILSREGLDDALETQRRTLQRLGQVLIEKGLVSQDDLKEMTALQTTETVYRLFNWKQGTYRFEPGAVEWDASTATPLRAESLLMEGFRQVDEWPMLRRKITSPAMTFERLGSLSDPARKAEVAALGANERRVFALAEPGWTLEHIIDLSRLGEFETSKALNTLVNVGLLQAVPPPRRAAAAGLGVTARAWAGRLRRSAPALLMTLALALVLALVAWLASERGVALADQGGSDLRDHAAQRFLARYQIARLDHALEVWRLENGSYPPDLASLVTAGLAERSDLRYPFREPYYYRTTPEGGFVLLQPLP
jgi:hypothetical protein